MKILKIIIVIILFILLTMFSQVGGIILLIWIFLFQFLKKYFNDKWQRRSANILGFIIFYMIFNLIIIPAIARPFNKVPLPFSKSGDLVPVSYWTCILNRHYITISGKKQLLSLAKEYNSAHPEIKLKYMDCNHPFFIPINGENTTPVLEGLLLHITHTGNKADIALVYNDKEGKPSNITPTAIGYGSSAEPLPGERCKPCECDKKNRKYSFMYRNIARTDYSLNVDHSRDLVKLFINNGYEKIILEPHLIDRFRLKGYNFGTASCKNSVRHDDHFHVAVKK